MASNLDALDLELSQTHKLYELVDGAAGSGNNQTGRGAGGRVDVGGGLMESLDLNTGYHGILDKRQDRMAEHLAQKYQLDLNQFEQDEQMLANPGLEVEQRGAQLVQDPKNANWLKNSIR